jgi:hypothetical protein
MIRFALATGVFDAGLSTTAARALRSGDVQRRYMPSLTEW